uniref:Uncharacterized protein n=1 Tax=Setaria viridis TaxID=4556 RepID=A0A4V6DA60_SETVI|nr:uncharacterized protein LOC117850792 [Setaria viridis]TKW28336.1 hypothetical protein SEVIR_3G311600v2 [Setaria viridis]
MGAEAGPSTTLSGPIVDMTMEDAPQIEDASLAGATISMLQEVIRLVEGPTVPESSGGVLPTTAEVASTASTTGADALALVVVTEVGKVGVIGSVVGKESEPEVAKSTGGPVLELPPESEIKRAIQSFQDLYDKAQRNTRALQERSEATQRVAQLEQECRRLIDTLRVHEEAAKSFAIERNDHEVLRSDWRVPIDL